ncbi:MULTISPECIES: NAD-dependent epimerase/dehydratase family protein [unclassified Mycolicibacterium]|uniref:NAD-dependent epimerase/dehydratase family protein n=1 Tax=unclassified Mycolicibacterium TaxID=2636767 RepID=UPI0012DCD864|nr:MULTISPECIES: NAD-dependent epimerase/dehydratase family protein [unclassified Mycolicibacterium]MUM39457.1 NAD-dependent epimerase/dehydratase family protein [Mycolicibacterium sp. CBMA 247]MUL83992.1 NAD-dependent epimerase/dehydratase family protein [Mycolicibacterium sp. CBMA 329]MUL89942.1 NAD-dependent epimerase/dehydratase family protein [Mycolicibacterium sp. CBMA 331]MUL98037.1 NAD-dependent epimerase/dehydratase family protein [Mycolicibacterium sp. CBMA 334]MUM27525.1 NAD-depende
MQTDSLIYIAGHRGMVGSAITRRLHDAGYRNVLTRTHGELPLDDAKAVEEFFASARPEYVVLAAAKVGGIIANSTQGADFIRENLKIQTNVIDAAYRYGVRKFMFLGSSCIYPKHAKQPIVEEALLSGPLEETNLPYAIAKIAGITMCDAYAKQYGFNAFAVMPPNVYGVGDNFHPEHSHVVAGLMRRFHEAKLSNLPEVVVWGTGSPLRELIDADDLADACVFLLRDYSDGGIINVGSGQEISIRDLALLMKSVVGFEGEVRFDQTRPDGTPRKLMDNSKLRNLGWRPAFTIEAGLKKMYVWFVESQAGDR